MNTSAEIPVEEGPSLSRLALVIPALDPSDRLVGYVAEASRRGFNSIVVVNDGSKKRYDPIFSALSQIERVTVLVNEENMGKGTALKRGFAHCLVKCPGIEGVVMTDSDGHHSMDNVTGVGKKLLEQTRDTIVLGSRDLLNKEVPLRTKMGAHVTRFVNRLVYTSKHLIEDGQTGLRAFSIGLVPWLLTIEGTGYEYDSAVLMVMLKQDVPVVEIPVTARFQDLKSHYRPVRDTGRIVFMATKMMLKFAASSITSWLLDFILFTILVYLLTAPGLQLGIDNATAILIATALARLCSATFNFCLNRKKVFKSDGDIVPQIAKFAVLACFILFCSASFVAAIQSWTGLPAPAIKVVVDLGLYFVNFRAQKRFIFRD